jgi:hypothetical protein
VYMLLILPREPFFSSLLLLKTVLDVYMPGSRNKFHATIDVY